jgi:hypothetical protein
MASTARQSKDGTAGNPTLRAATTYRGVGLSFTPVKRDGSKVPGGALLPVKTDPHGEPILDDHGRPERGWEPLQARLPTEDEVLSWYARKDPPGIGLINGKVSGNLELLDFDKDADANFPHWCELVEAECPGLAARLTVVRTPRRPAGYHVRYRCPGVEIPGNTKLAEESATDPGTGKPTKVVLIETRGEGGYGLAPGSPAECHEERRAYEHLSGPKLSQVQPVTAAERELLWRCARSFNRVPPGGSSSRRKDLGGNGRLLPGEEFDVRGPDWLEILAGWSEVRRSGSARYLRRPGKDGPGWSATAGACKGPNGEELLYVFSSNADPFEANKAYGKFRAYALLHHADDFSAAARELGRQGYGDQKQQRTASAGPTPAPEGSGPKGPEPWPDLILLSGPPATPPFPTDCLSPWLRRWVEETAEATQTPPDLAAMLSLGVCAAALAGKFRVEVRDGWGEPLNVFTVTALPVGDRKTTVLAAALAPVQAYEAKLLEEARPRIAQQASARRVLENQIKNAEQKAGRADDPAERAKYKEEARKLTRDLAAHPVDNEPQLFCDDETPEHLAQLLARQGGRILQASAEGTAFEIAKGRYSETANFDVYLKGHAGDPLRVGRTGREADIVDHPALTLALAVQPDVIAGLAGQATMRGRGFLARPLWALPGSKVGSRKVAAAPVSPSAIQSYQQNLTALWELAGGTSPHRLRFSAEADAALQELERWLEPQLGPEGELSLLAGWANKLAGAVARLAGVLHVAGCVGLGTGWNFPLGAAAVREAVRLGKEYLLPHAQAVFCLMGADERVPDARRVLAWLRRQFSENLNSLKASQPEVKRSDLHAGVWGGSRTVDQMERVLELLCKHNILRPKEDKERRPGPGRQPGPVYEVNPAVLHPDFST